MTPTAVVRPLPGPGLVARSGDLLLVCAEGAGGVEELLGLVAEVASAGGDGGMLVRRVAALLAADFAGRFPACAACGPTADGRLAVLVHGTATARVVGVDGEVALSAADAITSVNRLITGPISAVRLELPGAGQANPYARLEAGVVSAAGVVSGYDLADAPTRPATDLPARPLSDLPSRPVSDLPPRPPASDAWPLAQTPAPAVESVAWSASSMMDNDVAGPVGTDPLAADALPAFPFTMPPPVAPEPPAFPPETPAPAGPVVGREPSPDAPFVSVLVGDAAPADPPPPVSEARPIVLGMACPNGHLNDPSAPTCITCGASMGGRPPVLREGPRPTLGVLVLDDGSAYGLDMGYVLGREPQQDPEVLAGSARPLKITDAEGVVSRRHVRVSLVGWDVQVIDLGSANGTYVQFPGDHQLHQLTAHHPVVIGPGTQVTMGRRWFRIERLASNQPPPGA